MDRLSAPSAALLTGPLCQALDREKPHQGRLRRYYRLTGQGRDALAAEAARQAANAEVVARRLIAHRPASAGGPS